MLAALAAGCHGFQLGHSVHVPTLRREYNMDAKWVPRRKSYVPGWLRGSGDVYGEQQSEYEAYAKQQKARESTNCTASSIPSPRTAPVTEIADSEATRDSAPDVIIPEGSSTAHAAIGDALGPLAAALVPHNKMVVECGGGGSCGPNSLARVLSHAGLHEGGGDELRRRVVEHATKLVRTRAVWERGICEDEEGYPEDGSVRLLIESSFATWATPGRSVGRVGGPIDPGGGVRHVITAERWLRHMAGSSAWIDRAFLSLAADCFGVEIVYYVVSDKGDVDGCTLSDEPLSHTVIVEPRKTVDAMARPRVELAYVIEKHFCAILPSEADAGGSFVY